MDSFLNIRNRLVETFILTSGAHDHHGHCILYYWGSGINGPVLIRIFNHKPVFFIPRTTVLPKGIDADRKKLELCILGDSGTPVDGLYFQSLASWWKARRILEEKGIQSLEADVRPEDRYLMERYITGSVRIEGPVKHNGVMTICDNPRLIPSDTRPRLTTLSLDIETGTDGSLYSIALDVVRGDKIIFQGVAVLDYEAPGIGRTEALDGVGGGLTGDGHKAGKPELKFVPGQDDLIEYLNVKLIETNPDIIIGWNVTGFDLSFLEKKSREVNVSLIMGRDNKRPLTLIQRKGSNPIVELEGRLVIDGILALRGTFHTFPNWKLDTVAQSVLGRTKKISEQGKDKIQEIERQFREDKKALARYNLEDTILVTEIFKKTGLLEQLVTRSLITGLPPDQVHRSITAFDRFFLPRLHRKHRVAPNIRDVRNNSASPGGMVFMTAPGIFNNVVVLDFKSLYPTLIRTFHIDPYSLAEADHAPLETPVGIQFSRNDHILPEYLKALMERRAEAQKKGDKPLSMAIKILMNSMYGVMGATGCRFMNESLPTAITGTGRWVLRTAADQLRQWGYQVLYGDTDSLFVELKEKEVHSPDSAGRELAIRIDEYFDNKINRDFGLTSCLEMEFEKLYIKLFLPMGRSHVKEGALKRYAGMLEDGSLEIKGMEHARSDSIELARKFQFDLLRRCFLGHELKQWIKDIVTDIRAGEYDDDLVYKRRLSQPVHRYKSPPPHVRAVKLLDPDGIKDLRYVEYLMTPAGPVPIDLDPKEIDYNHYIEKQIKPLADDVLRIFGDDFDSVTEGRQLELFD